MNLPIRIIPLCLLSLACSTREEMRRQNWCHTPEERARYVQCVPETKQKADVWTETAERICREECPERWTRCFVNELNETVRCWVP